MNIIFCTCPAKNAAPLARALIENKLAACVNVLPAIQSFYEWDNKVLNETETLLFIKAPKSQFTAIENYLLKHHPYNTPEIVGVPAEAVTERYEQWIQLVSKDK